MPVHQTTAAADRAAPLAVAAPWNVAVCLHRETVDDALKTVDALAAAARPGTVIDLLVNGQPALAAALGAALAGRPAALGDGTLRLWSIALGDRAHAWNTYFAQLWSGSGPCFFVDGYARVRPDALSILAGRLAAKVTARGATAVPSSGRTAAALRRQMLADGGMHGNLFVLQERTMAELRAIGFRLPLGLYRTDATLGAALAFDLAPERSAWQLKSAIEVVEAATWDTDPVPWLRWAGVRATWNRRIRQAQGALENRAVRWWFAVQQRPVSSLPDTALDLVGEWARNEPADLRRLIRGAPLAALALRRLQSGRDWRAAATAPLAVGRW